MTDNIDPTYQQEILVNTLYAVLAWNPLATANQLGASLEVIGGVIDVYGSQIKPVSPPAGMTASAMAFSGINAFGIIPNFLYLNNTDGDVTSVVLTGVKATVVS